MSRSFPPPPVRTRPPWTATVPLRRVLSVPATKAVTPPPTDLDRSDRFVTAPDAVVVTTTQPRERRPLKPLPVEASTEATSAPAAVAATPLAPPAPEASPTQARQAPSGEPINASAPVAPEVTQAPAKTTPEAGTSKRRHKPGPAERRRLKAARDAAKSAGKSAGKPFDNDALFLAVAGKNRSAPAPEAPKTAPVPANTASKPISGSAVTQAAENRITLLRGQLVNDCESLANTAKSVGRRIASGETPRADGEFGLICRAMDARCTALYELLLLTRTR